MTAPRARRTAYLGAYGFGNLGDELCLIEAMRSFPSDEAYALTVDLDYTGRAVPGLAGAIANRADFRRLKPDQVVYGGGGIGKLPGLPVYLDWMGEAQAWGAATHVHNVSISKFPDLGWLTEAGRETLRGLSSFSVRDYKSVQFVAEWELGLVPRLSHFPERVLAPDMALADAHLPTGVPLLGISMVNTQDMLACLKANTGQVTRLLDAFRGSTIVPVVSQWHRQETGGNDAEGFAWFRELFLQDWPVAMTETLDRDWWYANQTPARIRGVVSRLSTLISQRKHNCVHAIGAGVRAIGLHNRRNDSLTRTFVSLANYLPPGSRTVPLDAGRTPSS